MKNDRARVRILLPPLFLAAALGLAQTTAPPEKGLQDADPAKRPTTDYMRSLLSQNTKPLGVKMDKSLLRLNRQPTIAWVARAARRHILD